ncbi:MAG: DUF3365 domain-containing protein [Ahniella sp.]|nr:DUF3365 domain-containing protein [Ahniella sp.]
MTLHRRIALALCLVSASPFAFAQMSDGTIPEAASQKADAAMDEYGKTLRETLMAKIASDGLVAAMAFCSNEAAGIATEIGQKHGVRIGRTSHRARNPANLPDHWKREALERFSLSVAQGKDPATLRYGDMALGRAQIARGIAVDAACLACHGAKESMSPEVVQELAKMYPQDLATGFKAGDLRGLMWVEIDGTPPVPVAPQ